MNEREIFLAYANEAAGKIRKVNALLYGKETAGEGGIFDEAETCIQCMIQSYLSQIIGEEANSDKVLYLATEIMYADEEKMKELKKQLC